jgi:glycosyl hydrolase family 26/flagellar hook capping protein FlgD
MVTIGKRLRIMRGAVFTALVLAWLEAPPASAALGGAVGPPATGIYLGAFVDPNARWDGVAAQEREIAGFERDLGRKLDIDHHYYGWSGSSQMFPAALDRWDVAHGRIPLISWQGTNLRAINSGSQDASIRARARAVRRFGHPVFISWGYEMNGDWNSWSGPRNNSAGRTNGPARFVLAWRRIHDIFDQAGARNVSWVWTPNNEDVPMVGWNHWTAYYPGDRYVDWVGVDGYNWGTSEQWSHWTAFERLFRGVYRDYAGRKPLMVVETASVENGGSKAAWIRGAWRSLEYRYPDIRALVWMERGAWSVRSSASSLTSFRSMAASSYLRNRPDTTPPSITSLDAAPGIREMILGFHLSEPARVSLTITNHAGHLVRTLMEGRLLASGPSAIAWNLRNAAGSLVPDGKYHWAVRAVDHSHNARTVRGSFRVG